MIVLDIFFFIVFLILTYRLKNLYKFSIGEKRLIDKMFLFHTLVCFAATPILYYGGDAHHYWMYPKMQTFETIWGLVVNNPRPSQIMWLICYFPSNFLGLSFLNGMLMFSLIGFWAFIFILLSIKSFIPDLQELKKIKIMGVSLFPYIFLLPNMHFWSTGIGKDTLLFFAVSIIIYSLLNFRKRFLAFLIGVVISYYVRPHILLFLVAGYGVSYVLSSKINLFKKICFTAIGVTLFLPLMTSVLDFAKIDQLSVEHLESFNTSKSSALSNAGSGVDFSGYPYPLKVLTFLFRPFFFDINGIPALIASIENLLIVLLFLRFLKNKSIKFILKSNILVRACFFYFIIAALAFAPVMSNLGIIIREKNMLMPAFLIFILASLKYKLNTKKINGDF